MVSFQPCFKLMLVSLNLVLLLGLQSMPALANRQGATPAENTIRRHAARVGRLSKRFPPVLGSGPNVPSINRRERHDRNHGVYGLTPEEIDQLLEDEQIQESSIYIPPSNATNTTTTRSHSRSHTPTSTDSYESSTFRSALTSAVSTSPPNTTSSASPTATSTTHSHSYTQLSTPTPSSNFSSPGSTRSFNIAATSTTHSHSYTQLSTPTPSSNFSSPGSTRSYNIATTSSIPSHTSSSATAKFTSITSQQGTSGTSNKDTDASVNSRTGATSSSAAASSATSAPTYSPLPSSDDGSNTNGLPFSSQQGQTSQPHFFGFTQQPTHLSASSAASSTPSRISLGLFPQLIPSSSSLYASSASAAPTASPTGSNSGSNSSADASSSKSSSDTAQPTDEPVYQNPTTTLQSASSTPTSTGTGGSPTAGSGDNNSDIGGSITFATSNTNTVPSSSTVPSGASSTLTAGPTSVSQTNGPSPTGSHTDGGSSYTNSGSNSGSSAGQQSSASSSTSVAVPTSSDGTRSGASSWTQSSYGSSSAATTNPYWYANTQSLNLAPSSTSSAAKPAKTGSQSMNHGSTEGSTGFDPVPASTSSGSGNTPAAQDLPTSIVPSANSYNQPPNTTSIGLLFKQDMKWTWVITQADLTAQIFAFMPDLVGQSVGLTSSQISTVKLASYSPDTANTAASTGLSTARTLYMAYVPTSSVEEIQALISNTSSPFYASAAPGAPRQLASQVDPTFNILSVVGEAATGSKQKSTSSSGSSNDGSTLRSSLIGVGCAVTGLFALVVGGLLWRKNRKDKEQPAGGAKGGLSRAQTIRSFSGGLRETWAPDALDQHRALDTAPEMQQFWFPVDGHMADGHPTQPTHSHADGFGGYVASDPFQDAAMAGGAASGYVNMNRSSRMTERSNYSDLSQMTEAQRIQYDYESSRRSFVSSSDHSGSHGSHSGSGHSNEMAGMASTYQEDYRVPRQHTSNHAFGSRVNSISRSRRRGSVASSTIGRPEMIGNSVLL
nr:Msb2 [Ustilago esculenta]